MDSTAQATVLCCYRGDSTRRLKLFRDRMSSLSKALSALAVVLLIQVAPQVHSLNSKFVDGRMHQFFDSSYFLLRSVHSIEGPDQDWRRFMGLTEFRIRPDGSTYEYFYNHHPVMSPALTRAAVRVFGPSEFVIRSYCLTLSLLATTLIFALLWKQFHNVALCVILSLLYAFHPLKYIYTLVWKYESASEVTMLLLLFLVIHFRHRARPLALALSAFLLFQTDFAAFIFCGLLVGGLLFFKPSFATKWDWLSVSAGGSAGLLTTLALQSSIGFGSEAARAFETRRSSGIDGLSLTQEFLRQWDFLRSNLGDVGILLLLVALGLLIYRRRADPLSLGGLLFLATNVIWCCVFRNHVYIHGYAQWFFVTSVVLLVAGAIERVMSDTAADKEPDQPRTLRTEFLIAITLAMLVTWQGATIAESQQRKSWYGSEEFSRALQGLDRRIVVLPGQLSGPAGWWDTPTARLYCDPIFRKSKNGGIVKAEELIEFHSATDAIVVANSETTIANAARYIEQEIGTGVFQILVETDSHAVLSLDLTSKAE